MNTSGIRNCTWGSKCEKKWKELIVTSQENTRFCDSCEQSVYYCDNFTVLANNVALNRCVSFPLRLIDSTETSLMKVKMGMVPAINFDDKVPF